MRLIYYLNILRILICTFFSLPKTAYICKKILNIILSFNAKEDKDDKRVSKNG